MTDLRPGMGLRKKKLRLHPFMTSTRRQKRSGSGGRMWTGERVKAQAPSGRKHRKLKLESTDVILSSSHSKKLTSVYQNFVFHGIKVEIFRRYKLVIEITIVQFK